MINRRTFSGLALGAAAFPSVAHSAEASTLFYGSVGPDLMLYALDARTGQVAARATVHLPANLQYAWPHPSRRFLYAVASNGIPGPSVGGYGASGNRHFALAFLVDPRTGALTPHGETLHLDSRPIHISVDPAGAYALIAYNNPSHMTVHRINDDGTLGETMPQPEGLDFGIYAHQVRATPTGRTVALVTRGNDALGGKPEDPGAIKLFGFRNGRLSPKASIAPPAGVSFGPRHLDFHPTMPLVFVSLERQNSMWVYGLTADGGLTPDPLFKQVALVDPDAKSKYPGQTAGPIHVHPNGRFAYQTNRGSGTVDYNGQKVWNGGENNIVVYAIDPRSGEPSLIQHVDAPGFETRTFTITPDGKTLIAASQVPMLVHDGATVRHESAGLGVYGIGEDGKLRFRARHDVDTSAGTQFWCGSLTMP